MQLIRYPLHVLLSFWWKFRIKIHSKPIRFTRIYSEIFIRTNPNLFESIRKKFSISFDRNRLKINPRFLIRTKIQSEPNESEVRMIWTEFSIQINPNNSELANLARIHLNSVSDWLGFQSDKLSSDFAWFSWIFQVSCNQIQMTVCPWSVSIRKKTLINT